jgi:serine protease Do
MKGMALILGKQPEPVRTPRGFLGVELAEKDGGVFVKAVLAKGPAEKAGLRAGDILREVQGKEVARPADVHRLTARVGAGQPVRFGIRRGDQTQEITVTAGEGL